jgi:hypothetical protein
MARAPATKEVSVAKSGSERTQMRILLFTLIFLNWTSLSAAEGEMERAKAALPDVLEALGPEVFGAVVDISDQTNRSADSAAYCNGRLTFSSGVAVPSSDLTGVSTVYFTPYNGNRMSLYASSKWNLVNFTEKSAAVPSTTSLPFDIFGYLSAGTLAIETLSWTNDTTRATSLAMQEGILIKSGDATRRYLGTGRTTGVSGQSEDSISRRFLWNQCNRIPRKLQAAWSVIANTWNWLYDTATERPAAGDSTTGLTRVEFVLGQVAEPVLMEGYMAYATSSNTSLGANASLIFGLNSTTSGSGDLYGGHGTNNNFWGTYRAFPAVGGNYIQWIEISSSTSGQNISFTGYSDENSSLTRSGIQGEIWQ